MVGRRREVGALRRLLEQVRAGESSALVLTGEPGIGKTALLAAARASADDFLCLGCRGAETEAGLAHAGLLELLTPLRHLVEEVPTGQAAALGVALGWTAPGPRPDRFLVAAGTLSLLAAAAAARPVLVLVDDLPWLDQESADALVFAARRLHADRVGFVMTARDDASASRFLRGLSVLPVGGLADDEAAELVGDRLAAPVVARLNALTHGSPLALVEVADRLTPAQRMGAAPLLDPLPAGDLLATVHDAAVAALPAPVSEALLLLALDPAAATSADGDALDEAVGAGILVAGEGGHDFRHPLLRSAVLRLASTPEIRDAHRRLADLCAPGSAQQVRHLAAAATSPDPGLAGSLVAVAEAARSRSGHAEASADLERSARLTPDQGLARDRLALAARDAFLAGDLTRARSLVDRVLGGPAPPGTRGRALLVLGDVEQYAGSVPRAADHLAEASALLTGGELVDALTERTLTAFRLGDVAVVTECAARLGALTEVPDPGQRLRARFTVGLASLLEGDHEAAGVLLGGLTDLALSEELRDDHRSLLLMALAAGFTGTVPDALRRGVSRVEEVRRRGAIGVLVPLLALTAAARAMVGDHARAFADAGEAVELAECLGFVAEGAVAVEQLAWQLAARGFHDDAEAELRRARELVVLAGTEREAAHHALTAAFCALCRDDLPGVVRILESRLAADGGLGAMGEPLGVAPMLVEAYVGLGRTEEARHLTRRLADVVAEGSPPGTVALLHRSEGLVAEDLETATRHFRAALDLPDPDPFEQARTRLLLGSRSRREGQRVAAREQLGPAYEAFAGMELTRWADVAAAELGAAGGGARARIPGTGSGLTSQETRVALLVAQGLSNKEVAAALFLSPRTVERHLGSVFRKRGFRSRSELVRAYATSAG
jgi:DNA-binding CsgD family transcriptional regulator/tetratricopeptide (TPR) repeat protein